MDTRLKKSVFLSLKQFVPVTFITVAAEIACIFLRRTLPFNFDAVLFAAAYLTGRIYYPFHTRLCASASCSAAFQARSFAVTTLFFTYGIAAANALIFAAAKVALKLPIKLLIETGYYQIQPPALPLLMIYSILWSGTFSAALMVFGYAESAVSARMKHISPVWIIAAVVLIIAGLDALNIPIFDGMTAYLMSLVTGIIIPLHRTVFLSTSISAAMWAVFWALIYFARKNRDLPYFSRSEHTHRKK